MERLTFDGSFCDIAKCAETPGGSFCENGSCSQRKVWERLKDYEDTGLTPAEVRSMHGEWQAMMSVLNSIGSYDRLRELAEADKDGRVAVLPCKVGDIMYEIYSTYSVCTPYGEIYDDIGCAGCEQICDSLKIRKIREIQPNSIPEVARYVDEIGKTVFLTREEAEKAMEAMKDG